MKLFSKPIYFHLSIIFYGVILAVLCNGCVVIETDSDYIPLPSDQLTPTKTTAGDVTLPPPDPAPDDERPLPVWTPTVNLAENFSLMVNCVEIVEDFQSLTTLPGALAIQEGILDLETLQLTPFKENTLYGELVSPDGSQLALKYSDSDDLLITNHEGVTQQKYTLPSLVPIYWLNNSTLVLHQEIIDPPPLEPLPSSILDLETGNLSQLPTDSGMIHTIWKGLGWKWGRSQVTRSSISPNLEYMVFAGIGDKSEEMVLWDVQNNQEITRIVSTSETSLPRWNNSGTSFVVSLPYKYLSDKNLILSPDGYELFQVNTDGIVEKISWMSEFDPAIQFDYTWSPDNRQIAFRMQYISELSNSQTGLMLAHTAILDTETGKVEDLCILASDPPVWSPTGNFLAIKVGGIEESIYIIDLTEHKAYLVYSSSSVRIFGWMTD